MYGERWKDWRPLNEVEQSDILRADLGYALGEDALGMGRFRDKYAAKMAETPDAHAFQIASSPLGAGSTEFAAVAHAALQSIRLTVSSATCGTLSGFERCGAAPADPAPSASSGEPAKAPSPAHRAPFRPRVLPAEPLHASLLRRFRRAHSTPMWSSR